MVFERTPGVTLEKIQSGKLPRPRAKVDEPLEQEEKPKGRRSQKRTRPEDSAGKHKSSTSSHKRQKKEADQKEESAHEKHLLIPTELPEGSSVLGVISCKTHDSLLIDLLCGLCGFVRLESRELSYYNVGQYMAALVPRQSVEKRKSEKKMIQLSISPAEFNAPFTWGQPPLRNQFVLLRVTSLEDHGLGASLETPINKEDGVRTFIPFPAGKCSDDFHEGQVVMGVVDEIKKGAKLIVCKIDGDMTSRYFGFNTPATIRSLRAGQLIECRVKTTLQNEAPRTSLIPTQTKKTNYVTKCFPTSPLIGVDFAFCQTLQGRAPRDHLHHPLELTAQPRYPFLAKQNVTARSEKLASSWPKRCPRFETDAPCLARVAAIVPKGKELQIIVTLLDHNVWLSVPHRTLALFEHLRRGTLMTSMRVVEINPKVGVKFFVPITVPEETKLKLGSRASEVSDESLKEWKMDFDLALLGWCPRSKIATETPEFKVSQMNIGQKMEGKLMHYNLFDSRITTYLSEEYLDEPICVSEDARAGMKIKGEVVAQKAWGLIVKLSPFVNAMAYNEMLSDTPSSKAASKYPVGATGKFRVLQGDHKSGTILLTSKRSLVDISEEELALQCTPMEQVAPEAINSIFHLYVKKHIERGLILGGYNNFFGVLDFDSIRAYMEDPHLGDQEIVASKKYAVGTSLRARLSQIMDNGACRRLQFSLDLDKTDPQILTKTGRAAQEEAAQKSWSAEAVPATRRLQPQARLPFTFESTEEPLQVAQLALKYFPVGTELVGRITHVSNVSQALSVAIFGPLRVWVHATELMNEMKGSPLHDYHAGESVSVTIKGIIPERYASLTPMLLLEGTLRCSEEQPLPKTVADLDMNRTYSGVIQRMDKSGLFVYLSSTVITRVDFRHLWKKGVDMEIARRDMAALCRLFPVGKVLRRLRIVHLSLQKGQSSASLKPFEEEKAMVTFESIEEGASLPAVVKRQDKYGIFVTLENSNKLDCLCPPSEIHDVGTEPPSLEPGDLVLAKVLQKDVPRRRIRVGLKASYFQNETFEDEKDLHDEEADSKTPTQEGTDTSEDDDEEEDSEGSTVCQNEEVDAMGEPDNTDVTAGSVVDDAESHSSMSDVLATRSSSTEGGQEDGLRFDPALIDDKHAEVEDPLKVLLRKGGETNEMANADTDGARADIPEDEAEMERKIRKAEEENVESKWRTAPKSIDDFERLLLVDGEKSHAWISYMGYFAQLADFESARKVAQRGIESMTFEQAEERLNIWIAWLNLEAHFGNDRNFKEVLSKALRYNKPLGIYYHVLDIYGEKADWKASEELIDDMIKKCGDQLEVWARALAFLYSKDSKTHGTAQRKKGKPLSNQAHLDEVIQRSVTKLAPKHHIDLQVIVARLEYKYVSSERGRTRFQQIISAHPKRLDLWNMFLDAQIALVLKSPEQNDKEIISTREIFKAATAVDFNPHKMKSLFKKWLAFEGKVGTDASFADIQQRAKEYVIAKQMQD